MKKHNTRKILISFIVLLLITLSVVVGVIAYKEHEYKAGTDYYCSLRLGDER